MRKFAIHAAICLLLTGLGSCSNRGEQAEVKEEVEQIENARIMGREAARVFINKDFEDSLAMQRELVEAGSKRAQFDSLPQSRAAYDSAFISTVRTVRPDVAAELEKFRPK